MRAAATTPAEPSGARVARFPAGGSLPRKTGGSASASYVSRPAQRSLALRPAWSLGRPWRPVPSECFRPCRCLHHPLRLLPAGATVAGRDSHPLGSGTFPRRTEFCVLFRRVFVSFVCIFATAARSLRPQRRGGAAFLSPKNPYADAARSPGSVGEDFKPSPAKTAVAPPARPVVPAGRPRTVIATDTPPHRHPGRALSLPVIPTERNEWRDPGWNPTTGTPSPATRFLHFAPPSTSLRTGLAGRSGRNDGWGFRAEENYACSSRLFSYIRKWNIH